MHNIEEKIKNGRQYRAMPLMNADSDEKIVRGYATTFNEEYPLYSWDDYEVIEKIDPHALDECDMSDVIMQYDHQSHVYARTSNGTLKLTIDSKGLAIEAVLSGTAEGRNLYEEIKGGYTTKMSFGFHVAEDKREIIEDHETGKIIVIRTVTKISKLYDVSAVSLPANDATEISARSFLDGVIKELEAERLLKAEEQRRIDALKLRIKLMEV